MMEESKKKWAEVWASDVYLECGKGGLSRL